MKIDFKQRTPQLIAIIGVLVIILAVVIGFLLNKNKQIDDMQQQYTIDKQELQDEYESISMQYEGFKFSVQNDSLLYKLENEQAKVQRLMEELRQTKATDQAEIRRLKNELSTLRKVLKSYIVQIDSLNRINEELKAENKEITKQYQQTNQTLHKVAEEKQQLSEKVTLAAKLDATNIRVRAVNSRGKEQSRLKRSEQFVVSFTISKNITAEPGERTIFVRIMKPDGEVLTKNAGNTFPFENRAIQYSMKRTIEYTGEETATTLYWNIKEFLMPGAYKTDIFADGNHIGTYSFSMEE